MNHNQASKIDSFAILCAFLHLSTLYITLYEGNSESEAEIYFLKMVSTVGHNGYSPFFIIIINEGQQGLEAYIGLDLPNTRLANEK